MYSNFFFQSGLETASQILISPRTDRKFSTAMVREIASATNSQSDYWSGKELTRSSHDVTIWLYREKKWCEILRLRLMRTLDLAIMVHTQSIPPSFLLPSWCNTYTYNFWWQEKDGSKTKITFQNYATSRHSWVTHFGREGIFQYCGSIIFLFIHNAYSNFHLQHIFQVLKLYHDKHRAYYGYPRCHKWWPMEVAGHCLLLCTIPRLA
jgi:hypothetical protein